MVSKEEANTMFENQLEEAGGDPRVLASLKALEDRGMTNFLPQATEAPRTTTVVQQS